LIGSGQRPSSVARTGTNSRRLMTDATNAGDSMKNRMKLSLGLVLALLLMVAFVSNCGGLVDESGTTHFGSDQATLGGDAAHGNLLKRALMHRYRR
jgi:hypothetical protein